MTINIEQYLNDKQESFRIIKSERPQFSLLRTLCCGELKKDKFYINCEDGQWDCKICKAKGNFNQLRDYFLDNHIPLENFTYNKEYKNKDAFREVSKEELRTMSAVLLGLKERELEYIKSRGIKEDTIREFKLGIDKLDRITIPIFRNNKVIDIVSHKLPWHSEKMVKYMHATGADSKGLLNGEILKTNPKTVVITEGVFDFLTIWQDITKNVVGTVCGAENLNKNWIEEFKNVKKIIIMYDNDKAGQEGTEALIELFGKDRTISIKVPKSFNDINDFVSSTKEKGIESLKATIAEQSFKKDGLVKHISEFGDNIIDRIESGEASGIDTGFPALNKIIAGYKAGHVILLGALTSVGKTTESLNLMLALAYLNTPTFFTSLEMSPSDIGQKLIQMSEGIKLSDIDNKVEGVVGQIKNGVQKLSGKPLYLFDGHGLLDYETVQRAIRSSVEEYGVRVAFIDYLQYFALEGKNKTAEVGDLVNKIKALAMELGITIFLITQLNRGGRSKQRTGMYIPSLPDLKDSSTLEQSADTVIFLCRDSESTDEFEKMKTILKVAKNRGGNTGHISLNYFGETGVFSLETESDYLAETLGNIESVKGDTIYN